MVPPSVHQVPPGQAAAVSDAFGFKIEGVTEGR